MELVFIIKYKDVHVKGIAKQEQDGDEIVVGYYHPTTGELQYTIESTLNGWKFQNEELNRQMINLIRLYEKYNDVIYEWVRDYIDDDDDDVDILVLELDENNGVKAVAVG